VKVVAILKLHCGFQTSSLPFTSGLLSCSLWLRYGILIKENTVILVNAIGVFLFALYCISYYVFTVNKKRMTHQLMLVILMITFTLAYSKLEPNDLQASRLIGKAQKTPLSVKVNRNFCFRLTLLFRWSFFLC
jgi:hypothetical protein